MMGRKKYVYIERKKKKEERRGPGIANVFLR